MRGPSQSFVAAPYEIFKKWKRDFSKSQKSLFSNETYAFFIHKRTNLEFRT